VAALKQNFNVVERFKSLFESLNFFDGFEQQQPGHTQPRPIALL
jgi:hypothetical protein